MNLPKIKLTVKNERRGFTLIELLIAISIISIVATIGIVSYSKTQALARDARRKNDLRAISQSLELFYQSNKHYPCTDPNASGGWQLSSSGLDNWISDTAISGSTVCTTSGAVLSPNFINKMPKDPTTNTGNPTTGQSYSYAYWSSNTFSGAGCPSPIEGGYYVLIATLENSSDPETIAKKLYKYCNGTAVLSAGVNDNAYVITSQ